MKIEIEISEDFLPIEMNDPIILGRRFPRVFKATFTKCCFKTVVNEFGFKVIFKIIIGKCNFQNIW